MKSSEILCIYGCKPCLIKSADVTCLNQSICIHNLIKYYALCMQTLTHQACMWNKMKLIKNACYPCCNTQHLCMHNLINQACMHNYIQSIRSACNARLNTIHLCMQTLCNPSDSRNVPGPCLCSSNGSPNVPGAYLYNSTGPSKCRWDHTYAAQLGLECPRTILVQPK